MLLSFSVENYKSISDEQTLSFIANPAKENQDNTFFAIPNNKVNLLKSCVIYGANATGKSNILKALKIMQYIVTSNNPIGAPIPTTPFLLDTTWKEKPSTFEINIVIDGDRYQYGFSCTKEKFINEWLYVYPHTTRKKRVFFERSYDEQEKEYCWNVTKHIQGNRSVWIKTTRENVLFLTNATFLNCDTLKRLYNYISNKISFILQPNLLDPALTAEIFFNDQKTQILKYLKAADLKICDLSIKKENVEFETIKKNIPEVIKEQFELERRTIFKLNIRTSHFDDQGHPVEFDMGEDESEGTKRLFLFAGPIIDVLQNGKVLVVDELETSLHPFITKFLLDLFHNPQTNPNNAQLLFTTHETSILTQDIFRRDQIWFTKLNNKQQTMLYPLTDFKPLKGSTKERLDHNYMRGKYGALPSINPFIFE